MRFRFLIGILVVVLGALILNDFLLHFVELLGIERSHPFYGFFWFFPSRHAYTIFWTAYWGIALIIVLILGIILWSELRKPKAEKPSEAKKISEIIFLAILIIFVAIYLIAWFKILPQLMFILFWPDVFIYAWVNFYLAFYWLDFKGVTESDVDRLSLAVDVMGGTIKAGIIATSILIPLCITVIELDLTMERPLIPLPSLSHLIVAVFWFGIAIALGLTNLGYVNELIGRNINILKERKVGITTNLQLYAIFMGILRILYILYIIFRGGITVG